MTEPAFRGGPNNDIFNDSLADRQQVGVRNLSTEQIAELKGNGTHIIYLAAIRAFEEEAGKPIQAARMVAYRSHPPTLVLEIDHMQIRLEMDYSHLYADRVERRADDAARMGIILMFAG